MEVNKIYEGDALEVLKTLPKESVDMCITSPPYWSLRDYEAEGQLGAEEHYQEYIDKLCDIFDEVKRMIFPHGTCWVNIGDSYSSSGARGSGEGEKLSGALSYKVHQRRAGKTALPPKSLIGIPERFCLEMQKRGWIRRNTIIWYKPNCMPSSVTDRFTVDFEYLYFFVKNQKYYFEQQYEDLKEVSKIRMKYPASNPGAKAKSGQYSIREDFAYNLDVEGRNKRCVWKVATKPNREAHFASYPPDLVAIPIKAGSPPGGVVLDPFMGSGTTGIEAQRLNRNWLGVEINPEYVKIANKRLSQKTFMI